MVDKYYCCVRSSLPVARQMSVAYNAINVKSPARTTDFATSLGRLDIARHAHVAADAATGTIFSEAMVPPADETTLDHTAVNPSGGIFITSAGTADFATESGCLDIYRRTEATALTSNSSYMEILSLEEYNAILDAAVSVANTQSVAEEIVYLPNYHVNDVPLSTIATASADAAIGTSVSESMVPPGVRLSAITTASEAVAIGTSVSNVLVPPADKQSKQHTFSTPPSDHRATFLLRPADIICAAYKYCSMQPGNIILDNIALYRHGGCKAIYNCDREGKNAYISDVVRVIEASGSRFLEKIGSYIFVIASTSTKMSNVKRRMQRKQKQYISKVPASTAA